MRERLQRFMAGRYGVDELSRFLNFVTLFVLVAGIFLLPQASSFAVVVIIINYFRIFSRNTYARSNENAAFMRKRNQLTGWFSSKKSRFTQRKTHRFYKCASCKKTIRIPRGKGKIEITCPVCQNKFIRRS